LFRFVKIIEKKRKSIVKEMSGNYTIENLAMILKEYYTSAAICLQINQLQFGITSLE